ncbi:MAG: hypothetical protein V3V49_00835 [Candidatus Krumholzibacteria bacterium]
MRPKQSFWIALVLGFVLVPTANAQVRIGEPFDLGVGKSVLIADTGVRVGFDRITSDSRCPLNVDCIWEGNATGLVWAETSPRDRTFFELNTHPDFRSEVPFRGLVVRLLNVSPFPEDPVIIDPKDYIVTMVVARQETTPVENGTWGAIKELFR